MRVLALVLGVAALVVGGLAVTWTDIPEKGRPAVKEPKRDRPGEAAAYWSLFTQTPDGSSPAARSWAIEQELRTALESRRSTIPVPPLAFEDIGPGNFGGRVRAVVIDPSDNDTLVVGGVSGGVWKTTDRGITWTAKDDFLANLAISNIIIDPDVPTRLFAGTGEGFFNVDAMRGAGIFVSNDFGETWSQLPATTTSDYHYVNRLARIPGTDTLIAVTRTGIYRSANLGTSFSRVDAFDVTGRGFVDVKLDPTDADHLLAYLYGASGGFPPIVTITAPGTIAGDYAAAQATFGPAVSPGGITGDIVLVNDGVGTTTDGCEASTPGSLTGLIAFIDRGSCAFTVKVKNAQDAGATAVIVANNVAGGIFGMGGSDPTITIPSVMISLTDGITIRAEFGGTVSGTIALGDTLQSFLAQSIDGGQTWNALDDDEGLPITDYARMEIGFGSDGVIYVAVANAADATRGLWRSADGGLSFAQTASGTAFIERQGWYDLAIAVDPNNSDNVLMGAVDQFATTNAGTVITKRTFWNPGAGQIPVYVHADHHIYAYDPIVANVLYTGTDGGIARSDDNGLTYEQLNNGLNIAQTYGLAVSPDANRAIAGTQDNGTHLYFGSPEVWIEWSGGDGGYVAWDQQQDNFIYGARPSGSLFGSNNTGATSVGMALPDTTGALFITPFVLDAADGNRLMIGTDNVFLTNNARSLGGASFVAASGTLLGSVSALAFDPHNSDRGYAGTTSGRVYRIDGLTGAPSETFIDTGLPMDGAVTRIATDPNDGTGMTLYVTMGNFLANRIYKTTDGGTSWSSIHGNLPALPLFDVKVDPLDPDRLWLGSELGLWTGVGNTGGVVTWERYAYGFPHTRLIELIWGDDDTLYATSHGRGTFRAVRTPFDVEVQGFSGLVADCDLDDILDIDEAGTLTLAVTNQTGVDLTNPTLALSSSNGAIGLPIMPVAMTTLLAGSTQQVIADVSLTTGPSCPGSVDLTATLASDQGIFPLDLSLEVESDRQALSGTFMDGAESMDTLLTTVNMLGTNAFMRVNDNANGGAFSWFSADIATYADSSLVSPWFDVNAAGNTVLTFDLSYDTEGNAGQFWDGAVLELRTEGGGWIDIGNLSTVPYDGPLFINNSAPARNAWSGSQTTWRNATVDLGTNYASQRVQFRFRMVCDESTGGVGFYVDNIALSNVNWSGLATCDACDANSIFSDSFEGN